MKYQTTKVKSLLLVLLTKYQYYETSLLAANTEAQLGLGAIIWYAQIMLLHFENSNGLAKIFHRQSV